MELKGLSFRIFPFMFLYLAGLWGGLSLVCAINNDLESTSMAFGASIVYIILFGFWSFKH
jgi:hypothetical protein